MLSKEQESIIESTKDTIVNSCAGSGKTTVLMEYAKRKNTKGIYLAYNSIIANEIKTKCPSNLEVTTAHSLAYRYFKKNHNFVIGKLSKEMIGNHFLNKDSTSNNFINNTLERFSNSELTQEKFFENFHLRDRFFELLEELRKFKYPVTHDMYLKFYSEKNINLGKDFFLFDEAQDISGNMINIINSQSGTKLLVGDTMQSIYSFRNCINGFDIFDYDKKYLTTSFRNNEKIASIANYISMFASLYGKYVPPIDGKGFKRNNTTCTICQTNFQVFEEKINNPSVNIVGSYDWDNIFTRLWDLVHLINNEKSKITNKFLCYYSDINHLYIDCTQKKDNEWLSLISFANRRGSKGIVKLKKSLEHPTDPNIFVSTVHKSKGLEWNKIILDGSFEPAHRIPEINRRDYNHSEELNKLYVAVTRAMTELIVPPNFQFPSDGSFWKKD